MSCVCLSVAMQIIPYTGLTKVTSSISPPLLYVTPANKDAVPALTTLRGPFSCMYCKCWNPWKGICKHRATVSSILLGFTLGCLVWILPCQCSLRSGLLSRHTFSCSMNQWMYVNCILLVNSFFFTVNWYIIKTKVAFLSEGWWLKNVDMFIN